MVHGWRTDRWSLSNEPGASAAKLDGLPKKLGDWEWQGKEEEMGSEELGLAEIAGYKLRTYSHPSGRVAQVLVTCGRPGPISVHTPDVCMRGAGFEPGSETRKSLKLKEGLRDAELMVARFERETGPAMAQRLRIFWAWSADGNWSTPENPRLTFARYPALFKLYVTCDLPPPDEKNDVYLDLISRLLNDLHDRLAPAS
jgi:hypothetical protein